MKRLLFGLQIITLILLILPGCNKDNGTSSGYIKGKIDGVPFSYTTGLWATNKNAGEKIIAFRADAAPNYFQFYLDGGGSDIQTGVYNFAPGGNTRSIVFYVGNDGYSAGQFSCNFGSCPYYGSGKITISSINKKHITGSFECVTDVSGATGVSKTVTEGEFDVERDK